MNFEDYESLPTNNVTSHMMAGALAGIMEHCVMYPLDSVKTRMQSLSVKRVLGIADVFSRMVSQEGLLRPVRGVQIVVMGAGPAHALYFSCYEALKHTLATTWALNSHLSHGAAGCIATLLHDGLMTPTDAIKQRMQMYNSPYRSILDCVRRVYRSEGVGAFYRSYTTQLTMNVPFQSIHFVTYEGAMTRWNPGKEYNPKVHMVAGALAGGVAAALTTPLDVCKTLLNTQSEGQARVVGLHNAVRMVYRVGGVGGFFKGLSARVIYQMPSTAICWSTYEFFKYFLIGRRGAPEEAPTPQAPAQDSQPPPLKPRELGGLPSPSLYGALALTASSEPSLLEVTRS